GAPAGATVATWAADRASPRLGVAGAASRIGVEDAVAGARVDLDFVEEARLVLGERSAVDREQDRVAAIRIETGRPHQPGVNLGSAGRDGGETLDVGELPTGDEAVADRGDPRAVPDE